MDAHDRAVDHLHLAVVRLDDGIHQTIPDARFAPTVKTIVGGCLGPISLQQIAPRRSRAKHPDDTIENAAIVARFAPATTHRQKRFDDTPLEVGQVVAHDLNPDVS
jgi:hypothetical protein